MREWKKNISDAFLPVGFPHSVSDDYLRYQTFDSLQAFFSTISSLLASRALLKGLGVGDASSSATFALILTVMQDAMSRITTILFAQRFGLHIEPEAKKYRFLADLFNDSAFFLELYSPYLSSGGKIIALSVSQALRAMCGVSAGASKAALSVHFARSDNLAELNAKEASQETAVGLVGLLVGTLVVKSIEDHASVVCLMILLVFAHLWMNYLAVRAVSMNTLNRQRATILFQHYLKAQKILTPAQVAQQESILFWSPVTSNKFGKPVAILELGKSYYSAMFNSHRIDSASDSYSRILICDRQPGQIRPIRMLLFDETSAQDIIGVWFKAVEIAWAMDKTTGYDEEVKSQFGAKAGPYEHRRLHTSFWKALKDAGWDLSSQAIDTGTPVRFRITPVKKDV